MGIAWHKVLAQPLGVVGYALFLVFGIVGVVARRGGHKDHRWILPVGFALAAMCMVGSFGLAFQRKNPPPAPAAAAAPPAPVMHIDHVEQQGEDAVAGVQGKVEINRGSSADASQRVHRKKTDPPVKKDR